MLQTVCQQPFHDRMSAATAKNAQHIDRMRTNEYLCMTTQSNDTTLDFLQIAKRRYACRQYQDRKVEPEKLEAILEAGRVAPTVANRQPQRLIVVESAEGMERLARCTRDFKAPCAIIVCADTDEVWCRKYDGK